MTSKYKSPNISKIVKSISDKYALDYNDVVKFLKLQHPELWKKEECANCGASMAMYTYSVDVLNLMLLQKMGEALRQNILAGKTFQEANKIKVQELDTTYAIRSRTTICSKLGLITKVRDEDGDHDQEAGWLITKRGFACLQNKPIPKKVVVFRNQIEERSKEMTTMSEVYATYKDKDYEADIKKYSPSSWFNVESYYPSNFQMQEA